MMAWKYKLDIADVWQSAKSDEIQPHELASEIAMRIRGLAVGQDALDIADEFDSLDANCTFDDTDDVMEMLYDWGDRERCWIATL